MRWLPCMLAVTTGCASFDCFFDDKPERAASCRASAKAQDAIDAQRDHDADHRAHNDADERATRNAAAPQCAQGQPKACLTVAIYDERHGASPEWLAHAYAVACDGKLAYGCFGAGRYAATRELALADHERGCALGEAQACTAAAALAPRRATRFYEAACALRDHAACTRAGFAYLYGANAPVDRAHARELLAIGCDHADAEACQLLGR